MRRAKVTKATMDALFSTPPLDYEAEFDEVRAGYPNQFGREQALKYYLADRLELGHRANPASAQPPHREGVLPSRRLHGG